MDTIIIGNGIISLTTALRLAKRAKGPDRIVIIGKKSRPGSATLAAAAMLNSFAEIESGSLDTDIDLFRFELSHLATRMWPRFVAEYMEIAGARLPEGCSQCEGHYGACFQLGTYLINNTASDYLDDINFNAVVSALKEFDEPYKEVAPESIPNYKPEQRYRATRAIYIPNEGWLNPKLTMEALESALSAYTCIDYIDDEVSSFVKKGNMIDSVVLKNGDRVSGDKYLLASGATVSDILDKSDLGLDIQKIFYGIGVSIEMRSPENPHRKVVRTPNRGLACGLYTVPFYVSPKVPFDSLVIGSSNLISPVPDEYGRLVSVQSLLKGAMEQINTNFFRASVTRINVGWRPTSSDTHPLIGRTSIPNLIIASGTKRDGFHLSPLLSEVLTSIIYDEDVDSRYEWFRPERKLIRQLDRKKAIEKATQHLMSASYQHGFVPPHNRMSEQMLQMYKEDLERLHDKVGAHDWGIPPEMIDMYRYGNIRSS